MTKSSWSRSRALFTIALAVGFCLAGCAAEPTEPAGAEPASAEPSAPVLEAAGPAAPAAQVSFVCLDLNNGNVFGRPLATLAACQAACPAPAVCIRCVGAINDCI